MNSVKVDETKVENLKTGGRRNGLLKNMQTKKLHPKAGKAHLKSANTERTSKGSSKKKDGSAITSESENDNIKQESSRISCDSPDAASTSDSAVASKQESEYDQLNTDHKSVAGDHDRDLSENENAKICGTVKNSRSVRRPSPHRGRLKRQSSSASGKDSKEDTSNDTETESGQIEIKGEVNLLKKLLAV